MKPGRTYSIHVQGKPPVMGKCVAVTKHLYVVELEQYTVCFRKKDTDIRVKEYAWPLLKEKGRPKYEPEEIGGMVVTCRD